MINIPDVSSRYGAPMGRPLLIPSKEVAEVIRVSLRRIRIYRDGYDSGGAYWGLGAQDPDGIIDMWFRAKDREDAKRQVKARCPNAMFHR